MLEGPILKLFPVGGIVPQVSVAELEPLIVMGTVDPELVRVAEPVTMQFVDKGGLPQVPVTVSVSLLPLAVKLMLPGTVIIEPLQSRVKL